MLFRVCLDICKLLSPLSQFKPTQSVGTDPNLKIGLTLVIISIFFYKGSRIEINRPILSPMVRHISVYRIHQDLILGRVVTLMISGLDSVCELWERNN